MNYVVGWRVVWGIGVGVLFITLVEVIRRWLEEYGSMGLSSPT